MGNNSQHFATKHWAFFANKWQALLQRSTFQTLFVRKAQTSPQLHGNASSESNELVRTSESLRLFWVHRCDLCVRTPHCLVARSFDASLATMTTATMTVLDHRHPLLELKTATCS
jgi:hypothetical protein